MKRLPNGERVDEAVARLAVGEVLGVPVSRYEGIAAKRNGMVDAIVHTASSDAPLEVVSDTDEEYARFWDALGKTDHTIHLPAGSQSWVLQLDHSARVKRLVPLLPGLLEALEPRHYYEHDHDFPPKLSRLGVTGLLPTDADRPHVALLSDGFRSWDNPGGLNDFVREVLDVAKDVPKKLVEHGSRDGTAHAFIWSTISSKWAVTQTSRDSDHRLPAEQLELPEGVTDVWVGVPLEGHELLRYRRNIGWIRTGWRFSEDAHDRAIASAK